MNRDKGLFRYPGSGMISRVILILTILLVVVAFIVAPLSLASYLRTPSIGALLNDNLVVEGLVTRKLLGSDLPAGLLQGDRILAVDGEQVSNGASFNNVMESASVGDAVTLSLVGADGAAREVDVTLVAAPDTPLVTLFILCALIGLVFIAFGYYVFHGFNRKALGWLVLMLFLYCAIILVSMVDYFTGHLLVRLWVAAVPITAGLLLTLYMIYPSDKRITTAHPVIRWLPILLALLLVIIAETVLQFGGELSHLVLQVVNYSLIAALLFFAIALLVYIVTSRSPTIREQGQLLAGGALLGMLPAALWLLDVIQVQPGWILFPLILVPAVSSYSLLQYSPLVSRRVMSVAFTYSLMGLMISIGYALLVAGATLLSINFAPGTAAYPVVVGLFVFLLAFIFDPLRERIQDWLDGIFYRRRVDFDNRLASFRHQLTRSRELKDILSLVRANLESVIQPERLFIFLREPESDTFTSISDSPRTRSDIQFTTQSGLVLMLTSTRDILFLEMEKPLPTELVEERPQLAILNPQVIAPLQGQDRLVGWISLGTKRSGELYSLEELYYIQSLTEQVSLAVERAQAINDLERRVQELDVLSQVSQAINLTDDSGVLMGVIHTQLSRVLEASNFAIIMHDADQSTFHYEYNVVAGERLDTGRSQSWPDKEGLESVVFRSGRPLRTDNYLYECRRRGLSPRGVNVSSWMCVPLNVGTEIIGVMLITSSDPEKSFTEEDLRFFWSLADQAAVTLEKLRLFHETETRAQQLATLNESSRMLTSTLDVDVIFENMVSAAIKMLDTEAGSLFLLDEQTGELVFRVVRGGAESLVGTRIPAGKGIVGEAVNSREPVVVDDVIRDHRWYSQADRATDMQTQRMLAVPLITQDRVLGVVEVINKRDGQPFTEEDKSLLATFATQAAVAIENARLYQATDEALGEKVSELEVLMRIDRDLNRTLQYADVVGITLDGAIRETSATAGSVLMLTEEKDGYVIEAHRGYDPDFVERYSDAPVPLGTGIVSKAIETGQPLFVHNVSLDETYVQATKEPTFEEIVVPFLRAEEPIGALVLESDRVGGLTDRHFNFAQQLAEHAVIAIENARLVGKIEQANRDKTQFISFVAHELKNPMTSIRGYTDLVRSGSVGPVTDMQGQFLGTIRTNIDRMTRLVSDLSDSARIETGHMRLEKALISIKDVIDESVSGLKGQIDEKEQTLVMELPDDLPFIMADHVRMAQVLTNLISNATKYTPEKGTITIGAEKAFWGPEEGPEVEALHCWVADTGIGMSEDELEKLFTKFFRATRAKDMASGTGLGMMITRSLVEAHGGELWVESEVDKGTTFHFVVPVPQASQDAS